jgi:hypothetical protein
MAPLLATEVYVVAEGGLVLRANVSQGLLVTICFLHFLPNRFF